MSKRVYRGELIFGHEGERKWGKSRHAIDVVRMMGKDMMITDGKHELWKECSFPANEIASSTCINSTAIISALSKDRDFLYVLFLWVTLARLFLKKICISNYETTTLLQKWMNDSWSTDESTRRQHRYARKQPSSVQTLRNKRTEDFFFSLVSQVVVSFF